MALVLDREAAQRDGLVEALVRSGVDWLQVRDRTLEGNALLELIDDVRRAARRGGQKRETVARVLVNRRADLALASQARQRRHPGCPVCHRSAGLSDAEWIG